MMETIGGGIRGVSQSRGAFQMACGRTGLTVALTTPMLSAPAQQTVAVPHTANALIAATVGVSRGPHRRAAHHKISPYVTLFASTWRRVGFTAMRTSVQNSDFARSSPGTVLGHASLIQSLVSLANTQRSPGPMTGLLCDRSATSF
jgi:hypothetical protein